MQPRRGRMTKPNIALRVLKVAPEHEVRGKRLQKDVLIEIDCGSRQKQTQLPTLMNPVLTQ